MTASALRSRLLLSPTLALVLVAVVWGLTYPLTGALLRFLPVTQLLALRFGLAALVLLPAVLRARPSWQVLLAGVGLGAVQALEFGTLTAGLALTSPGRAAFLVSLSVVLVGALEALLSCRRPSREMVGTVLLLALGLGLLTRPGSGGGWALTLGDGLCLACALFTALQVVLTGRLVQRRDGHPPLLPGVLVGVQAGTVAAVYGAVTWLMPGKQSLEWAAGPVGLGVLGGLILLAMLATVLALLAQTWAQGRVSAGRVAVIYTLEPVVAALVSVLWLGEQFAPMQVVGGVLILAVQFIGPMREQERHPG